MNPILKLFIALIIVASVYLLIALGVFLFIFLSKIIGFDFSALAIVVTIAMTTAIYKTLDGL